MGRAALVLGWRRTGGILSGQGLGLGVGLALTAVYDDTLARVRLVGTGLPYNAATYVLDRYDTAVLTNPETVRGGESDATSGDTIRVDDYAFTPGVVNTYRLRVYAEGGALLGTVYATVTPELSTIWLKSVARPFLNRTVTVVDFSGVSQPARGGVLEVQGRRLPVAVTEVRGSRRYELVLRASTRAEVDALELFLSFGDVVMIQVPGSCVVPRTMFAFVADVEYVRVGKAKGEVRYLRLPLTEVDAPDDSIVGFTVTWAGVVSGFATWADVKAAFSSWLELQEYVSNPVDEVTG